MRILLIACVLLFSSCAKDPGFVEGDSMLYITNRAVKSMMACIEEKDKEACTTTDYYFEKYPWLRQTRDVKVGSLAGMTQNKWDSQKKDIEKNLRTIALKNTFFVIAKSNMN